MNTRRIGLLGALAFSTVLLPPAPTALGGQEGTGTLRGTVVTARDGIALPGALVALDAGVRVFADADGAFVITGVRAGPYRIAAVAAGCHTGLGQVEVVAGTELSVRLTVQLPEDVEDRLAGWTLGARRSGDATHVVTREDIRRRHSQTLQDAIRLVAPEMVGQGSNEPGASQRLVGRRSATVQGPVQPLVVVDGVPLPQRSLEALSAINIEDVERIEVSKGAAGGWAYGNQGANGVIRIVTRSASASVLGPETPPDRCGFTFSS